MTQLQRTMLAILTVLIGCNAGTLFLCAIGIIPAIQRMPPDAYIRFWQAMDFYMNARMPVFGLCMAVAYFVTLIAFRRHWRTWVFAALTCCLVLSFSEMAFTAIGHMPINRAVNAMTAADIQNTGLVVQYRDATVANFRVREWLAISSFVLLSFTVAFASSRIGKGDETAA